MNYILFDPPDIEKFYPFTLIRPLGEMRLAGITIKEYWEQKLGCKVSYLTRPHLSDLYPVMWGEKNVLICSSLNFQALESDGYDLHDIHRHFIHIAFNPGNIELNTLYAQVAIV